MGEGTDPVPDEVVAARAQVVAARGDLALELERLEAAARAAVDIPAKVRRNPVTSAGLAAGAGFLLVGGPRRVLRGARNAVFGKPDPLPRSMLPEEIDRALRELGTDGEKVRGTLEREFADYLEEHGPERRKRDTRAMLSVLALSMARPIVQRSAKQLVEQLFAPGGGFNDQLAKVRSRRSEAAGRTEAAGDTEAPRG